MPPSSVTRQECESKIAQEIASLSKEDVSKEEMTENEEEVVNILLAQVRHTHMAHLHCETVLNHIFKKG